MRARIAELAGWIRDGGNQIGQVRIDAAAEEFRLWHCEDEPGPGLRSFFGADAAIEIASCDDLGAFRPLKTAPTLQRGWLLTVAGPEDLLRALDYLYPAMAGVWSSHRRGLLQPIHLRETLARQSGMYRVAQKISDEAAQGLIGATCRSDGGCLKRPLWMLDPSVPILTLPPEKLQAASAPGDLPLLCHEACNVLVAKAREVVKLEQRSSSQAWYTPPSLHADT